MNRLIAPRFDGFMRSRHHIGFMFRTTCQKDAAAAPGFYWPLFWRIMTMAQPNGSGTRGFRISEGTR